MNVQLPAELVSAAKLDVGEVSHEAAKLIALELFREDGVSMGRAAELCETAFVLLLLWPLLAAILPEISLPLSRGASIKGTVIEQFTVGERVTPVAHSFVFYPLGIWLCAAIAALAPLLVAHWRFHALMRRTVRDNDETWASLLNELSTQLGLGKAPELLVYPGALMPMVFGVWRPRIVLPVDCRDWPQARRRVVLLHELAHIARRDLMTLRCARLIAACWWFQPLAWIALRSLRRESERACDELVICAGVRPSDYAAELLAIAQGFSFNEQASIAGIAMARAEGLEGRLRAILDTPVAQSKRIGTAAVFLLAALTITASAVTLYPETETMPLGGHTMKHALLAALLTAAGLSAATMGGSVYDSAGLSVGNATASLVDFNTELYSLPMMQRLCRVLLCCLLLSTACGRHAWTFRVLPATPAYLLQSPDSRKIPFTDVTHDYNGFQRGQGWIDLRPLMELRIENAYYEKGASRRGLTGYLGTEVAHFETTPAGLKLLLIVPMKDRPPSDAPVENLIPKGELNFRYYRLYFEIFFGGVPDSPPDSPPDSHGSVLLGANSQQELAQISAQLTHPETVCNAQSLHCAVFPEACSVSIEMKVVVNGKTKTLVWGSLLREIADHPRHLTVKRLYRGRLVAIRMEARDPNVLTMPLLPGDQIAWN